MLKTFLKRKRMENMEQTSQEQRIEKLIEELDSQYFGLESLTEADVKEIIRRSFYEGCKG